MAPEVQRVRFEGTRFRMLEIARVEDLSPHYRRLTMMGDLDGFATADAADHLKVVIPANGQANLPVMVDGQCRMTNRGQSCAITPPRLGCCDG